MTFKDWYEETGSHHTGYRDIAEAAWSAALESVKPPEHELKVGDRVERYHGTEHAQEGIAQEAVLCTYVVWVYPINRLTKQNIFGEYFPTHLLRKVSK